MRAHSIVLLLGLSVGCLKTPPAGAPQVQPEPARAAEAHAPAAAPRAAAGEVQRLGSPITETTPVALAEIVQHPNNFAGRTVRTEGTVSAVCQAAGCWMQLSDNAQRVHVKMHGHAFFIPRNATGRRAVVQATVISGNPNGHCEQEAAEQTGQPVARLELDATGVELL